MPVAGVAVNNVLWCRWHRDRTTIVEVFMKRVLLSMVITGSMLVVSSVASVAYSQDQEGLPAPDADKGAELYTDGDSARGIISCASCHGDAGNSTLSDNPNLAGLPYEYINKQLLDFVKQDGADRAKRLGADGADSIMAPFAALLEEEDRANIAYYLSTQELDLDTAPAASNEDTMERGQQIWRGGIPEKRVPACAACHGASGAGIPGEFPRLAGQYPDYIAEQLHLFSTGDRDNSAEMHDIADRMSDADIAAVADYAAGLR